MRKQLLRIMALVVTCLVGVAQAQTSSGGSSGSAGSPGSSSGTTDPSGSSSSSQYSPTGRMGHHEVRATQLTGADVKGSSGESLATINDVIINPHSGRVDFAILSLSNSGSSSGASSSPGSSSSGSSSGDASSGSSSSSSSDQSSSSSSNGKQVAVPWMLLRTAMASSSGSSSSSSSASAQPSFTFTGDATKLQSAPSFDQSTDLTQPSWRQSVFSYFGLTPGSATGGATSPGGSSSDKSWPSSGSSSKP